ncbi:hemerythrin domain-containing protein [Embleya sp. NPDC020886]|uniref:hemerythrin domain-containing protein n=1 Tax=Embleya sp. NPDC020886 TaxID=3363980 RepID=UPI00379AA412
MSTTTVPPVSPTPASTTPTRTLDLTPGYVAHRGLREELARLTEVTRHLDPVDILRVRAVEEHLALVLRFLRAHHREEHTVLYPWVRAGSPRAARTVTAFQVEHSALEDAMLRAADRNVPLRDRSPAIGRLYDLVARHSLAEEHQLFPLMRRHVRGTSDGRMPSRTVRVWGRDLPALVAFHLHHATEAERRRVLRWIPPGTALLWRAGWRRAYERRRRAAYGS